MSPSPAPAPRHRTLTLQRAYPPRERTGRARALETDLCKPGRRRGGESGRSAPLPGPMSPRRRRADAPAPTGPGALPTERLFHRSAPGRRASRGGGGGAALQPSSLPSPPPPDASEEGQEPFWELSLPLPLPEAVSGL